MGMRYTDNVRAWWGGFERFAEIQKWKPGWSGDQLRWKIVYALNHGTRALTGGPCVTWSRWWYENREKLGHAKFMTRALNHFEDEHGANSGPALWGTSDSRLAVPGAVLFLVILVVLAVAVIYGLARWLA